jgi:CRP/FNR family cyclic AMP-dependent transcriptional regulator
MPWRLLQQAPVKPDSPEFARWLCDNLTRQHLAGLPDDDVKALGLFAVRRRHPPQVALFSQGRPPDAVHIIERGAIDLVHEDGAGSVVVQTVRRGAAVGDLPAMLGLPHAYSAITQTETTVLELRMETIRALVELDPSVCFRFLRLVSSRLAGIERRVLELGRRAALQQLVALLLRESEEQHSSTVRLTQAQIAGELGLSRQTISRILGELERQQLVKRRRGRVVVADLARLQMIADPHSAALSARVGE